MHMQVMHYQPKIAGSHARLYKNTISKDIDFMIFEIDRIPVDYHFILWWPIKRFQLLKKMGKNAL